jgi:hypothetical protein
MSSKEYQNISKKKFLNAIKKLSSSIPDLVLAKGTNHYLMLKYPEIVYGRSTYPLNINHGVNGSIIFETQKWLVKNKICTKEKFDGYLGRI